MLHRLIRRIRRPQPSPSAKALDEFRASGDKLVYADVGSAGGIPNAYRELSRDGCATLLLFDPQEDWRLNQQADEYRGCDLVRVPAALASASGSRMLHITAAPGCSSFLKPDQRVLAPFPVREWFSVTSKKPVVTKSFTAVRKEMGLPIPDILKVDVQGAELEVLQGFGESLTGVAYVELEVNLEPLYEGQPTLGEVYRFLKERGYVLRDLKPQGPFEGAAIEFNSFWSRHAENLDARLRRVGELWRAVHGVWPGEYFSQVSVGTRSFVRFTDR